MNSELIMTETTAMLRNLSSALGLLKGALEDEGKHVSSEFAENAQDLIDEAAQKLTFAVSALDETVYDV